MRPHQMLRQWILPAIFFFAAGAVTGQNRITGKVTDAETGTPLIGATVENAGTGTGTVTDLDGNYAIEAVAGNRLRFSYIGYTTIEKAIGNESVVDIAMTADGADLSEVVVTALGIRKEKKALTYAVQTVQSASLV